MTLGGSLPASINTRSPDFNPSSSSVASYRITRFMLGTKEAVKVINEFDIWFNAINNPSDVQSWLSLTALNNVN